MNACPAPDRLQALAADELEAAAERPLRRHLAGCAACRERIGALEPTFLFAGAALPSLPESEWQDLMRGVRQVSLETVVANHTPLLPTDGRAAPGALFVITINGALLVFIERSKRMESCRLVMAGAGVPTAENPPSAVFVTTALAASTTGFTLVTS